MKMVVAAAASLTQTETIFFQLLHEVIFRAPAKHKITQKTNTKTKGTENKAGFF